MRSFLVFLFLFSSWRVDSALLNQGVFFMDPGLLTIHYHPSVVFDFTSSRGNITVPGCNVSSTFRSTPKSNLVALTLSACTSAPQFVTIGNATLFTAGATDYISEEVLVPIEQVYDPVVTNVTCQSLLNGSSVQVYFNDPRWDSGLVRAIDCSSSAPAQVYNSNDRFSFMVAEWPLGSECSATIAMNYSTVWKEYEFDAEFAGCGVGALNPVAASVYNNAYLIMQYATESGAAVVAPDVSKLTLTCRLPASGALRFLVLSPSAILESDGVVRILIENPCGTDEEVVAYNLSVSDGFLDTSDQRVSAANASFAISSLADPKVTGHSCDNNVHYFPVSSALEWRMSQLVDNGSCVLEAGYSSTSINIVINEPVACVLVFEIEILSTKTKSNTTVTIDYDCPYTQPSSGFFDLPLAVLILFFMFATVTLIIFGIEFYWLLTSQPSYFAKAVDLTPKYIEQLFKPKPRDSLETTEAQRFLRDDED